MSYYYSNETDWFALAGDYANALFRALGYDKYNMERYLRINETNPIIDMLQKDPVGFVEITERIGGGTTNMAGTSRAVVLVQMMLYDITRGPDGDGKPKGLRRHWYAYYKQFAQMFATTLGKTTTNAQGVEEMKDVQWSGRMSQTYAGFVDSGECTYKDMWIEDASRMMQVFSQDNALFTGLQLIIAVEKDSLFNDFVAAASALGARAVISGKGKNSKAAAERMLRKMGWETNDSDVAYKDTHVIHLSDFDFDGHAVIGPTFGEQMRRYCHNVIEGRFGVNLEQVQEKRPHDVWDASYQVKVSNKGYREWSDKNALFWATCTSCGHEQYVRGCREKSFGQGGHYHDGECHACGATYTLLVSEEDYKKPHGFEVESLKTNDYYEALVLALLELIDWADLVYEMRVSAIPGDWEIQRAVKDKLLEANENWQKVRKAEATLAQERQDLEWEIEQIIYEYTDEATDETRDDWVWLGDEPDVDDLIDYVKRAGRNGYVTSPFRPFPLDERVEVVAKHLEGNDEMTSRVASKQIPDYDQLVATVKTILTGEM